MHADQAYISEAFKSGASGYLLKRSAGSELVQAIQAVMNGNYYVTSLIAKNLVNSALVGGRTPLVQRETLTARQREVLQLVAEGRTIKEIATVLSISPKTVEFHKSQLMEQLDLHTTAELTKYALTHGLIASE
jgi:DNA-binding NarL/FixJ family response regulator